jgi:hypothetical protein
MHNYDYRISTLISETSIIIFFLKQDYIEPETRLHGLLFFIPVLYIITYFNTVMILRYYTVQEHIPPLSYQCHAPHSKIHDHDAHDFPCIKNPKFKPENMKIHARYALFAICLQQMLGTIRSWTRKHD